MNTVLARAISILGHPLPVLSLALLASAALRGGRTQAVPVGIGLVVFASLVMAYSWWQVRRGRWAHVDASRPYERRSLNRLLLLASASGALVAWAAGAPAEIVVALALSVALVLAALLAAPWCTLSLHLAFAVFAAFVLALASWWATVAGLAFAAGIAWSRLVLSRHAPRDLAAGAVAGALAGTAFVMALQPWQA